eukprot:15345523-Alexandrium_andersonii.AAC.1
MQLSATSGGSELHKAASSCRKLHSATFCNFRLHKALGPMRWGPLGVTRGIRPDTRQCWAALYNCRR